MLVLPGYLLSGPLDSVVEMSLKKKLSLLAHSRPLQLVLPSLAAAAHAQKNWIRRKFQRRSTCPPPAQNLRAT